MCDEPQKNPQERQSQLELRNASPDLREVLGKCVFEARHVTGKQLEVLDALLPPLKRDKNDMHRYGRDVSVVFRLYAKNPLVTGEGENRRRLTELCVTLNPNPPQWRFSIPVQPDWAIKIQMNTFPGGVLYHASRVFGPENGIGENGVREKLVSGTWDWHSCGAEFRKTNEIPGVLSAAAKLNAQRNKEMASEPVPTYPADSDEAKLSVVDKFVTGKDMRLLDRLFDQTQSNAGPQPSDDDLYLVLRLHTVRSLGEKTHLISTTVDVFADHWPFPDTPFPAQSVDLDFIQIEDGVVYCVKRIDDLPQGWGKGGARELLLSKEWKTRLRHIKIK